MKNFLENSQYIVLMLLIVGQCTVGSWFMFGQIVYLIANIISTSRTFMLRRPTADKIKDCACLGITAGIILIRVFS
jgi:hypothetical protein